VGAVLEFLQERFSTGLSPSTLKVYVAALAAYHVPFSGVSLGRHPLITRFLRGTLRLRPAVRAWNFRLVWLRLFYTLGQVMFLRSLLMLLDLQFCRLSVLLHFCRQTRRNLICSAQ
jgi:hypothetical protein